MQAPRSLNADYADNLLGEIIGLLKRIVRRIRTRIPDAPLIFRADSHHAKLEVLDWLEANGSTTSSAWAPIRS